jgi:FkbM family methyltransferase
MNSSVSGTLSSAVNGPANGSANITASSQLSALRGEDFHELARNVEQLIVNVTTQMKINETIVSRLLALERRVAELANMRPAAAAGNAAVARAVSTSTIAMPVAPALGIVAAAKAAAPAAAPAGAPAAAPAKDALPMYLGNSLALCRVMNSFPMYVDTRDIFLATRLLLSGEWEPGETQLMLRLVRPGMTFVDVGANFGYFTLLAAAGVGETGRVYAFEPEARNLEILDRNLQLNGYLDRVKVFRNAVLDGPKKVQLHRNRRNFGNHTLYVTDRQNAEPEPIAVDAVALDDAVEGAADFIKIDAQGSEPLIFRGMRKLMARSPRLVILAEFNLPALQAAGFAPRDFLRELSGYGFAINSVTPQATWVPVNQELLLQQRLSTLLLTRKAM